MLPLSPASSPPHCRLLTAAASPPLPRLHRPCQMSPLPSCEVFTTIFRRSGCLKTLASPCPPRLHRITAASSPPPRHRRRRVFTATAIVRWYCTSDAGSDHDKVGWWTADRRIDGLWTGGLSMLGCAYLCVLVLLESSCPRVHRWLCVSSHDPCRVLEGAGYSTALFPLGAVSWPAGVRPGFVANSPFVRGGEGASNHHCRTIPSLTGTRMALSLGVQLVLRAVESIGGGRNGLR